MITTTYQARVDMRLYAANGPLIIENANAIEFRNQGEVVLTINNVMKILPGQSASINQYWPGAVDQTQYRVKFDLSDPESTGTKQELAVISSSIQF